MTLPEFKPGIQAKDPSQLGFINLGLGESPYGMSSIAYWQLQRSVKKMIPYPDSSGTFLKNRIADFHSLNLENVFLGNGIDEIILTVALTFLGKEDKCLLNTSTFVGFEAAVQSVRGNILFAPTDEQGVQVEALIPLLRKRPRLWFLCNPHNPTGSALDINCLERLLKIAEENGVIAVIDEAYIEYANPLLFQSAVGLLSRYKNLIVMRTFSKIYGLAGLRCGYALGHPCLIQALWKIKHVLPFSVNTIALQTAQAALYDQSFIRDCYLKTREVKTFFCNSLDQMGVFYTPSQTNFVLVRFESEADLICDELKNKHQILIRSGKPFGFSKHARITLGTLDQMRKLVEVLSEIKGVVHGPLCIAI